jgi:hypothetical protein
VPFPPGANEDDDRVAIEQRLDFAARFMQRFESHSGVMPGAQTARGAGANEASLLFRQVGQRKLVGVQETRGYRAAKPFGVPRVTALCDSQVASERRFHRSQNVAATTTRAQKKDMHVTPVLVFRPLRPGRTRN